MPTKSSPANFVGIIPGTPTISLAEPECYLAPRSSYRDTTTAATSRKELLAWSAGSGQRIYAVHFPFPGIGRVEKRDDRFVWFPE